MAILNLCVCVRVDAKTNTKWLTIKNVEQKAATFCVHVWVCVVAKKREILNATDIKSDEQVIRNGERGAERECVR